MRKALSLTEVLISMGILTLGLLGVAAVFPVGSHYIQRADIYDKASAIGQSVMSDIVARGMLDPNSWYVMVPHAGVLPWSQTFSADGASSPNGKVNLTFTRPFSRALGEALTQTNAMTDKTILAKQFGSAYVIDPLGVAAMAMRSGSTAPANQIHGPAAVFPAAAYTGYAYQAAIPTWPTSSWLAWCGPNGSSSTGYQWPIRRVTFRQPNTGWHANATMAEHFFRGNDDLAFDFPQRADKPAFATWDMTGVGAPLARKFAGDYSWIITVVPPTNAARNAMASNPEGFAYDVSVVVFYKRALLEDADASYLQFGGGGPYQSAMNQNERAVRASVVSTGLNGGELLLTDYGDYRDASNTQKLNAFDHLKLGHWVMLCGPHPNSSTSEPRFVLNWYQVISVEQPPTGTPGLDTSKNQRLVTVRGAEWPWQPTTLATAPANDLSVAICKGAVAVHTKSMRLQTERDGTGFGSSGNSTTTPPPWSLH